MSLTALLLLLAQSPTVQPVATDTFGALRAIVLPSLMCERGFDAERRKLAEEEWAINQLPDQTTVDSDKQWHEANAAFQTKFAQFRGKRAAACKTDEYFGKLEKRLSEMQPKLTLGEVGNFALGLFKNMQANNEFAADFRAGWNHKQFTPPSAPPPMKN